MDFASGQMLWVLLLLVPGLCALVPFIDFLKKKKILGPQLTYVANYKWWSKYGMSM